MDSYMASNGSCCMVTWTTFKNHRLEVDLTQNWEIMALQSLTTVDLFYFTTWIEIHWNSIRLRARSHMTSQYTWGSVTTLHDCGGVLGRPLDTFLLGSHNLMVTALGSCVKWPLESQKHPSCSSARWIMGVGSYELTAEIDLVTVKVPNNLTPLTCVCVCVFMQVHAVFTTGCRWNGFRIFLYSA